MGIHGEKEEIVRLPGFWSLAFKIGMIVGPLALIAICGWLWSLAESTGVMLWKHETRITVLETRMTLSDSHRDTLTTSQVASAERVTSATVLHWAEKGYIEPPPVKTARGYVFSKDYRIMNAPAKEQLPIAQQ